MVPQLGTVLGYHLAGQTFVNLKKGVFWKRRFFKNVVFFSRDSRALAILEIPQSVETKGESAHAPETLENLVIVETLAVRPVKRHLWK